MDFKGIVVGRGEVDTSKVVPWGQNPRDNDHAVPDIIESFNRFGVLDPLVVRQSDMLLAGGHTRLKAARILGISSMPVVWIECDDDTFKRAALALNKLAEVAHWKEDVLTTILRDLASTDSALAIPGWSEEELAPYLTMAGDQGAGGFLDSVTAGLGDNGLLGDGSPDPLAGLDPDKGGKKAGKGVISYQMVFSTDAEQEAFFAHVRRLKKLWPDAAETVASRILRALDEQGETV